MVFIQQISMNAVTIVRSVAQPRVSTLWGSTGVSVSRATPSKTAPAQVNKILHLNASFVGESDPTSSLDMQV